MIYLAFHLLCYHFFQCLAEKIGFPYIRFFIPEGADVSAYTFKQGGRGLEYTIGTAEAEGKTYTTVDISVYAYRMCDTITCYINGVASGTYHINAYYEFAKNDADLKAIVEAFWTYCQSARAYKASVATVEN